MKNVTDMNEDELLALKHELEKINEEYLDLLSKYIVPAALLDTPQGEEVRQQLRKAHIRHQQRLELISDIDLMLEHDVVYVGQAEKRVEELFKIISDDCFLDDEEVE